MKKIKTTLLAAVVAVCLVTQVPAASVTLDTLLSGGTITSGDKMLSDFSYTHIGDMPAPEQVVVSTITDANGNYGVRFNGPFFDMGGDGVASDSFLEFTVTVLDPNMEIIGVQLIGNPSVVAGNGVAQITETFLPSSITEQLEIYDLEPGTFLGFDETTFAHGYASLTVQKDILLSAEAGAASTLSFFDQVFVQQLVPEPASMGLFGFGFVGLLAWRKRRSA